MYPKSSKGGLFMAFTENEKTGEKNYFPDLKNIDEILIQNPDLGCVVSNKISVEGYEIGCMYRDEPLPDVADSGWVFLAGDEDADYMNTPGNMSAFPLNTMAHYDPAVIPLLDADVFTAYCRDEDGKLTLTEHFFDGADEESLPD